MEDTTLCPFCGFKIEGDSLEYAIMLHIETHHPDGPSSFIPRDQLRGHSPEKMADQMEYVECAVPGCGEAVMLTELDSHIMLHEFEDEPDTHVAKKIRVNSSGSSLASHYRLDRPVSDTNRAESSGIPSSRDMDAKEEWKKMLNMPKTVPHKSPYRRLGKSELGPYANEDQMPEWLVKLLESDGERKLMNRVTSGGKLTKVTASANWASGILAVVAQLLEQDPKTEYAYLCQPDVLHISKLKREGGFCGYRNIQMLVSNMAPLKVKGYDKFEGKVPTIFQIQDYIENAWDSGYNSSGREETGGIKGTRKYIGTPDAQAMLLSLEIPCEANAFKTQPPVTAQELLYEAVENYFASDYKERPQSKRHERSRKVRRTLLPSIYFQHPGHSMTIVGIEKKTSGAMNLLVFDPMFHDNEKVTKHIGRNFEFKKPADLLRAYRRGSAYLKKYREFEILKIGGFKPDNS